MNCRCLSFPLLDAGEELIQETVHGRDSSHDTCCTSLKFQFPVPRYLREDEVINADMLQIRSIIVESTYDTRYNATRATRMEAGSAPNACFCFGRIWLVSTKRDMLDINVVD